MQEHQQRQQERLLQSEQQERWSRGPRRQSSCSSMASSTYFGEDDLSLSPFEGLCLELRSVEDSIYRSLRAPASAYASEPIYFR